MADRVIIVGLRRAGVRIPASELKQLMGRAGRSHETEGSVELIVETADESAAFEMLEEGSIQVESSLADPDYLAMSLIPEIHRGEIDSREAAEKWCERCFCDNPPLSKAFELLSEVKAVRTVDGRLEATYIGSCAAKYYFHPADVYSWYVNFSKVFEQGLEDDEVAPAWALGCVPFDRIVGDLGDRRYLSTDCRNKMPFGLNVMQGSMINVVSWWYLIGGPSPGAIRPACLERRKGFGRYVSALKMLNHHAKWHMSDYFDELEMRVKKGLPPQLVPLCKFEGMTKARADYLYNMGIRSGLDFVTIGDKFDSDIDDDFKETIEKIARQFSEAGD